MGFINGGRHAQLEKHGNRIWDRYRSLGDGFGRDLPCGDGATVMSEIADIRQIARSVDAIVPKLADAKRMADLAGLHKVATLIAQAIEEAEAELLRQAVR